MNKLNEKPYSEHLTDKIVENLSYSEHLNINIEKNISYYEYLKIRSVKLINILKLKIYNE
jgi:hypothetical protein